MHKILMAVLIFTVAQGRAEGLWRDAGQACVFGGSVLGITSILVLYPAMAVGTNSIPVASLILGNTLFGCGIAAIGASAAYGFGRAYDRVFTTEPAPEIIETPPPAPVTTPQSLTLPPPPPVTFPPTMPTPPPGMVQSRGTELQKMA